MGTRQAEVAVVARWERRAGPWERRAGRWGWKPNSLTGTALAVVVACASFTPSLLPRDWGLQALIDGLSAAAGYALGLFLAWCTVTLTGRQPSVRLRRRLWVALAVLGVPLVWVTLVLGQRWQAETHRLMGEPPPDSYAGLRILLLGSAILFVVVGVGRVLRWLVRRTAGPLERWMPPRLAPVLAVLLVTVLVLLVSDRVVGRALLEVANSSFSGTNRGTKPGDEPPRALERSGSPSSLIAWDTLGRQGRDFVSGGPGTRELSAFSGQPAREPVRVYAGLDSSGTTATRARLAVDELRRAGGFDRAALVVITTTGTGLVDPANAEAVEYLYNGDSAIVAMQYSFLPSWISFLVDQEKAHEAGRELFDQVYAAWSALPEGDRPQLLVSGLSLGAFGSEGAFTSLADVQRRTDGVVWAGPPNASELHREVTESRDPGSPEWLPVVDGGREVVFTASAADLERQAAGTSPDVVYLQHGSDPIVYWSPSLLFERPDWLTEAAARDVSEDMFWMPFVTFWQVTADLPFAGDVPLGHGHTYREDFADAWAAVAPPPGWGPDDTLRLRAVLARTPPN